jgi:hypothetical protein
MIGEMNMINWLAEIKKAKMFCLQAEGLKFISLAEQIAVELEQKDALCRELLEKLQKANDDLRHYTYIDHYLDLIKRAEEILNK